MFLLNSFINFYRIEKVNVLFFDKNDTESCLSKIYFDI